MNEKFELIAKTFQGLEQVLAEELTRLGAEEIEIGRRMVSFVGDKEMMYRANFCLRTAVRILKPIKHFQANNPDEVYEQVKDICWENYLDADKTFAVDAVVFSEEFRHSKFVAYRVKDAVADYFREKTGKRPSVRLNNPDAMLSIHIAQDRCTLSLDSSGESLHRRGYRQETLEAPLNEVLAAGMILMTGWHGECDFIDPMCGSGTLPIEAGLIARNIAPGVFRQGYAFEKWADFDAELFESIYNDESQEREFEHKIYGYDNNPRAIDIASRNVKAAGLSRDIVLDVRPVQQFQAPTEKSILVTNPPYGERISSDDLLGLYDVIGERLKHAFQGNTAWVLSYRQECFDHIGLKASQKVPLFNGALECEFRQYDIFEGKYREQKREEGEPGAEPTEGDAPRFPRREFRREEGDAPRFPRREFRREEGDGPRFPRREFRREEGDAPRFPRREFRREEGDAPRFPRREFRREEGDAPRFPRREFRREEGDGPRFPRREFRREEGDGPRFPRREFRREEGDGPRFPRRDFRREEGDAPRFPRREFRREEGDRRFDRREAQREDRKARFGRREEGEGPRFPRRPFRRDDDRRPTGEE